MDLVVKPGGILQGEATFPADKSISHRALILGALSIGTTILKGFLQAKDCLATLEAIRSLGVDVKFQQNGHLHIQGVGLTGLQAPSKAIDCGNSGTSMRLLTGLLAALPFKSVLTGDSSLQKRPMARVVEPLTKMGAKIFAQKSAALLVAPLQIEGMPLQGIAYTLPVASAQVKSCLLLAGLLAKSNTVITENIPTRDHTERMLNAFGCDIKIESNIITLSPGKALQAQEMLIPGDFSSAAFFIAGASMIPGSHIKLRCVGINERRIGLIHILKAMGANISIMDCTEENGEPIGDIEVKGSQLQGITVPAKWVVSAIDEFPILFIVAACAVGTTHVQGVAELRVKECDRIAVMAKGLSTLGIKVEELPDGMIIQGGKIKGGLVESQGDHRVAMAFAMASLVASKKIVIRDSDNIATSFPNFCEIAKQLGLLIEADV
ncbi:MAG: 3-phosphoshikimate 1-carboxyvinyltransferase [Proteobacteria bacterium]|nr:3-phosphoshikimate 1-carboxyvinyltransferase [Pseudomonadota bacterium]